MPHNPVIPDGLISRAVRQGIAKRRELIDAGTPEPEADRIVGADLKAAWERSSKAPCEEERGFYVCKACHDSGWIVVTPTYYEQIRLKRVYGENPQTQSHMRKCDPCPYLEREREKRRDSTGELDGLAAAGQTKRKTSKFSKW